MTDLEPTQGCREGSIFGRELASLGEVGPSDHERKLIERCGKGHSGARIHPELVVPSPQALDEGIPPDHDAGASVPFETPHGPKPCLEASVVRFDSIVGVLRNPWALTWMPFSALSEVEGAPATTMTPQPSTSLRSWSKESTSPMRASSRPTIDQCNGAIAGHGPPTFGETSPQINSASSSNAAANVMPGKASIPSRSDVGADSG